jgi:hypothetical protein
MQVAGLHWLQGAEPYYAGVGAASASCDPCTYSIHQGAIGGKVVVHLQPTFVTTVDEVPPIDI